MDTLPPINRSHVALIGIASELLTDLETCESDAMPIAEAMDSFYLKMCEHIAANIRACEAIETALGTDSESELLAPLRRAVQLYQALSSINTDHHVDATSTRAQRAPSEKDL